MSNKKFIIDSKIQNDTILIDSLELSQLLLMNDEKYPWFVVVPRVPDVVELIDLNEKDQRELLLEINLVSTFLQSDLKCDKINVATLGNVVKQLHIHVIARFHDDASYPNPVWCGNKAVPYAEKQVTIIKNKYNDFKKRN